MHISVVCRGRVDGECVLCVAGVEQPGGVPGGGQAVLLPLVPGVHEARTTHQVR